MVCQQRVSQHGFREEEAALQREREEGSCRGEERGGRLGVFDLSVVLLCTRLTMHCPVHVFLRGTPSLSSLSISPVKKSNLSWVCIPCNLGSKLFYFHLFISSYLDVKFKLA